ncbi:MAG: hypothetical protein ACRD72_13730 [Candidatus Angelobacter sp.]
MIEKISAKKCREDFQRVTLTRAYIENPIVPKSRNVEISKLMPETIQMWLNAKTRKDNGHPLSGKPKCHIRAGDDQRASGRNQGPDAPADIRTTFNEYMAMEYRPPCAEANSKVVRMVLG